MLVRVQSQFPATGEVLAPFEIGHYVAGDCHGSHNVPLMPLKKNSPIAYFDGPAMVQCLGFSIKDGKLIGPVRAIPKSVNIDSVKFPTVNIPALVFTL